jgi:hypothetical protein
MPSLTSCSGSIETALKKGYIHETGFDSRYFTLKKRGYPFETASFSSVFNIADFDPSEKITCRY